MEIRIGVTYSPKEIEIDLGEKADPEQVVKQVEEALAANGGVVWLTDRRGRRVGVPGEKIAYIEIGPRDERRVGFGLT